MAILTEEVRSNLESLYKYDSGKAIYGYEDGLGKYIEDTSIPNDMPLSMYLDYDESGGDDLTYGLPFLEKDENSYKNNSDVPILDKDWINCKFMTPSSKLSDMDALNRYFSTADWKTEDTRLGNHAVINPLPQFTRYCDIRVTTDPNKKIVEGGTKYFEVGMGMGRYYSEAIDDYQQQIFMQFGVPEFNSLLNFFTRAVAYEDVYVANHGRYPYEYAFMSWVGSYVAFRIFPWKSIFIWLGKLAFNAIAGWRPFNYYYLNPTMHMYWGSVNTIVSSMAVELGMMVPIIEEPNESDLTAGRLGVNVKFNESDMADIRALMPNLFSETTNYIDVFRIATTHQVKAAAMRKKQREGLSKLSDDNIQRLQGYIVGENTDLAKAEINKPSSPGRKLLAAIGIGGSGDGEGWYPSFENMLKRMGIGTKYWTQVTQKEEEEMYKSPGESTIRQDSEGNVDKNQLALEGRNEISRAKSMPNGFTQIRFDNKLSLLHQAAQTVDAVARDGGLFVGFRVDYTGPVTDSFSNSTGPIQTGEFVQSMTGSVRHWRFNLGAGNVLPGMDSVINVVKNVVVGGLDGVTFGLAGVIASALSGAYIDLPEKWEESSMNLGGVSYKFRLVSPYGNMVSQLQNIYIPLACIMAGVLPLATGKSSHGSPFICNLFCKGVQNIELGIITELTIERGTSNLGFNKWRQPLAIDVSFTVKDLSTLLTAPINMSIFNLMASGTTGLIGQLMSESTLDQYLGALCARDLYTSRFAMEGFNVRFRKAAMKLNQVVNPNQYSFMFGEFLNPIAGALGADDKATQYVQSNRY